MSFISLDHFSERNLISRILWKTARVRGMSNFEKVIEINDLRFIDSISNIPDNIPIFVMIYLNQDVQFSSSESIFYQSQLEKSSKLRFTKNILQHFFLDLEEKFFMKIMDNIPLINICWAEISAISTYKFKNITLVQNIVESKCFN